MAQLEADELAQAVVERMADCPNLHQTEMIESHPV